MHILHIEDDKMVQALVTKLLSKMFPGVEVTTVDNAPEAINALGAVEFTLVISDFDLLQGTGGDVWDWLKANRPEQRFMFFSGNEQMQAKLAALGALWLLKPAGRAEFTSAVLGALG